LNRFEENAGSKNFEVGYQLTCAVYNLNLHLIKTNVMKKIKLLLGILSVLAILFAAGCQDLDGVHDTNQKGHLVIKLTDAPFPIDMIDSAMVYITKVEIRMKSEGEELGYPYITLLEELEEPLEFNLLELRNGITAELVDMEIEAGHYDLIRLYVEEASLTVKEGETYNMKVPSGSQTGIKMFIKPDLHVAGGLTTEVLLDFNIEKSFILKGNTKSPAGIKGFNFKPVIRAVNISTAGTIEGMVTNSDTAIQAASVWIEQDTVFSSAFTDEFGYYAMPGIPTGLYTISATIEGFDTVVYEGVEIIEGNLTVQDFTLTKLEEPEEE
jgi:hypothetical protein